MATDSLVAGLFSDPSLYEQQQLAVQRALNERTAQLTPEQQVTAGLRTAGYQLGQGLGGLMGVQDPQLKQISIMNELASQFDTSTSGGVAALAQALSSRGLQQPAIQLGQRALEMRKLEAESQAKTMERLTNEQKNAAGIADASGAVRGTPEWSDTYKTELSRLTAGVKGANIKEIGVAEGTRQPVYFDVATDTQFVMRPDATGKQVRVPFSGGVDRTTAKTSIDIPLAQVFDKAFSIKSAEEQAKNWDLYGQAYATIPSTRAKLGEVRDLIDQSFSGAGANVKLGASKLARSLNLPIDVNKASNTEIVEALTTQFAISELKKNFGSNPAVKDFEAQLKVKPGILQEPETFKKLVDKLDQGLQAEEIAYRQGKAYQKGNKNSIVGFDPYAARADATTKLMRLNSLVDKAEKNKITDAERQEAKKLQGELNAAQ